MKKLCPEVLPLLLGASTQGAQAPAARTRAKRPTPPPVLEGTVTGLAELMLPAGPSEIVRKDGSNAGHGDRCQGGPADAAVKLAPASGGSS